MATSLERKSLVMYVRSGPPEAGPSWDNVQTSMMGRLTGMAVPQGLAHGRDGAREPSTRPATDELPRQQALCVRLVLDVAQRHGCPVRLIDVSRESASRGVRGTPPEEADAFPILIRPDGARLAGEEAFTAGKVRKFLRSMK